MALGWNNVRLQDTSSGFNDANRAAMQSITNAGKIAQDEANAEQTRLAKNWNIQKDTNTENAQEAYDKMNHEQLMGAADEGIIQRARDQYGAQVDVKKLQGTFDNDLAIDTSDTLDKLKKDPSATLQDFDAVRTHALGATHDAARREDINKTSEASRTEFINNKNQSILGDVMTQFYNPTSNPTNKARTNDAWKATKVRAINAGYSAKDIEQLHKEFNTRDAAAVGLTGAAAVQYQQTVQSYSQNANTTLNQLNNGMSAIDNRIAEIDQNNRIDMVSDGDFANYASEFGKSQAEITSKVNRFAASVFKNRKVPITPRARDVKAIEQFLAVNHVDPTEENIIDAAKSILSRNDGYYSAISDAYAKKLKLTKLKMGVTSDMMSFNGRALKAYKNGKTPRAQTGAITNANNWLNTTDLIASGDAILNSSNGILEQQTTATPTTTTTPTNNRANATFKNGVDAQGNIQPGWHWFNGGGYRVPVKDRD